MSRWTSPVRYTARCDLLCEPPPHLKMDWASCDHCGSQILLMKQTEVLAPEKQGVVPWRLHLQTLIVTFGISLICKNTLNNHWVWCFTVQNILKGQTVTKRFPHEILENGASCCEPKQWGHWKTEVIYPEWPQPHHQRVNVPEPHTFCEVAMFASFHLWSVDA